ncbi:hypothetical protein [Providencia rettgeri]|uniref:phage tail fiber protein n=1 Tax=Providencia rettgeri TaxID=587 RepID=UPI001BA5B404|nr:hypothetical protein [Providencia rettgeri]MBS0858747.1 hypothetical protein [Providencia rettgeri]MBS0872485.1 hypothetical protein [Providencia rettgeri]MBS0919631.1 hypothetical protein [Providencia rettgeri]
MYSTGTVTTTANSTKLVGTNTKWLNNINRVSAEQAIQIQIGTTVHNNSIQSIQSDTELTLNFPLPTAATGAKYVILTTMVHSASDAMNKIVAMQVANVQFSDILTRWMTEQGIITVTLPDQTTQQLRTTKEMDKQLDGKLDKAGGTLSNHLSVIGRVYTRSNATTNANEISIDALNTSGNCINSKRGTDPVTTHYLPTTTGTLMQVGDYGWGGTSGATSALDTEQKVLDFIKNEAKTQMLRNDSVATRIATRYSPIAIFKTGDTFFTLSANFDGTRATISSGLLSRDQSLWPVMELYHNRNTTKDSNGNLKASSPVVKLFADDIELNDESEGVEMEHLGIGHYLIKGVVGFNADGAWGINNGFVIPQDHNGKNMVLIDYEVRPDGDIEVFVFHQQNADMPERFQNKRIKHFDEEGVPVYFENYEPCDVPESRWIDMRVEMPPNSLYNQKQAEAERLAKLEAERLAQEEAEMGLEI